ncbi:MAG: extracellular solute-binding protein [Anaerolineae bacterium]|nr:extracellular solute-binding protein [Anaerolineae bacterium]
MQPRRFWYVLLTVLVLAGMLAGCTQATPTSQPPAATATSAPKPTTAPAKTPVTLTFWHHFAGPQGEEMEKIVNEWNKAHPEIQVKINVVPFSASAEYSEKMTAAAASGQPPDVFLNPAGAWAVGLDLAIPLDDYMKRDKVTLDDYYPGAVQRVMWLGKAYGIPFNMDTRAIWWNKQLFKEAGLDPEKPPKTWAELEDYCKKLVKKDAKGNADVVCLVPAFDQAFFYGFIIQNGGIVQTQPNSCTKPELKFDSPEAKEALAFMKRLADINGGADQQNAFLSSFTGGANDAFYMGKMAMMISGPWRLPDVRKFVPDLEFGLAPEPLGPKNKGNATLVGGFEVSIPKLSKNYDAAWEFVKYLGGLEVQIRMSKVAGNTPGHKVPANHPYLQEDKEAAFFVKAGDWSISFPEAPWSFPLFFAVAQDAVQEVLTGAKDVDKALADARVKVQEEIDRWFTNHPCK